jgi:hypothetical protein
VGHDVGPKEKEKWATMARWAELLRWQAGKLKRKPEITYGLHRSMGQNEMGRERKKIIVFAIFSDSRKWDRNQKF